MAGNFDTQRAWDPQWDISTAERDPRLIKTNTDLNQTKIDLDTYTWMILEQSSGMSWEELERLKNALWERRALYLQELSKEYKIWVSEWWSELWLLRLASIDLLTKNIDASDRLDMIKQKIEPTLDEWLKEFTWLSQSSKNLIKISFLDQILSGDVPKLLNSMQWSALDFFDQYKNANKEDIVDFLKSLDSNPVDSGRATYVKTIFYDKWQENLNKIKVIWDRFWWKPPKDSNFDCSKINWLNISTIKLDENTKLTDIQTIENPNDPKRLWEIAIAIANSRDKIEKFMESVDSPHILRDNLLNLLNSPEPHASKWLELLMEVLLHLPVLWGFIKTYFWLEGDNPKLIFDNLKLQSRVYKSYMWVCALWVTRDERWVENKWVWIFKEVKLNRVQFDDVKSSMKDLNEYVWEDSKEIAKVFDWWIETKYWVIKFELGDAPSDAKGCLSADELNNIIKKWLKDVKREKWKNDKS